MKPAPFPLKLVVYAMQGHGLLFVCGEVSVTNHIILGIYSLNEKTGYPALEEQQDNRLNMKLNIEHVDFDIYTMQVESR